MESAPREGPTVSSERYLIPAGRDPDRMTSERSSASCWLPRPVIRPESLMAALIVATLRRVLSKTTPSLLPMLAPVNASNFLPPSGESVNDASHLPTSSREARAFRRSWPVATDERDTKYQVAPPCSAPRG